MLAPEVASVLIVEDDPDMVLALRELLDGPDRDIVVAESGEEALRCVLATRFAVILLDVKMPGIDGYATARLIRQLEGSRNTPMIFLTGVEQDEVSVFRGYEAGAVDYLLKPVAPEILRSKVSVFIELHRYNAALVREIARRRTIEEDLRKAETQLRTLAARIESVREDERTRLAREVHDQLGQALTGLKMDLSWLGKQLPEGLDGEAGRLESMVSRLDAAIRSVRRISSSLRPPVLDDVGLVGTLKWQAKEFQVRTGIRCRLDLPAEELDLDPAQSTAAFRILQEALANVAHHAGATRVDLGLRVVGDNFILKIADNGRGVSEAELRSPNSLGFAGIRERALLLGGKIDIAGKEGEGTTVTVSIPHRHAADLSSPASHRDGTRRD